MSSKRSHTKSRLGCKQCKQRRIKCDEIAPCCTNCANKGLECEYQSWTAAISSMQLFTPATYSKRASPQTESSRTSTSGITPNVNSSASAGNDSSSSEAFTLDDLGLLHYFTIHTSWTVGQQDNDQYRWVWQYEVPRLAQSNKFLMHAVLGCAAADRAQSESIGEAQHADWAQARHHYDRAINFFREAFDEISAEQAEAQLCFSILLMLLTVCLDLPQPVRHLDPVETFTNLMGTVHRSVGVLELVEENLGSSIVGNCLLQGSKMTPSHTMDDDVANALTILEHLNARYNIATKNASAEILADSLAKLREFYSLTTPRSTDWSSILSWPRRLRYEFISLLKDGNPLALCMVGHWAVALSNAPVRWHMPTWPQALIVSLAQRISGTEWAEGMSWPLSASLQDIVPNTETTYHFDLLAPEHDVLGAE